MHFVSYCETELFKKTYRNNLNNVLQNLLNEFYTYAKSAFVTLTKVYAISQPPLDHEIAGFGGLF